VTRLEAAVAAGDMAAIKALLDEASDAAAVAAKARDAEHAAFHGRQTLRYARYGGRSGMRNDRVCQDCRYGRAWMSGTAQ
jgi:hypothetical protein